MTYSKSFPYTKPGATYAEWIEVRLTEDDEKAVELGCREENIVLMKQCILDAHAIAKEQNLKDFQTDIIQISIALFEKRASHTHHHKEQKAKEKFDTQYK